MVLWDLFAKQDYHALHHYRFFYSIQLAETKVLMALVEMVVGQPPFLANHPSGMTEGMAHRMRFIKTRRLQKC
jgi:hypothetical protein